MKIMILETQDFKKGTALAKWFTATKRYDGSPVDDFVAAATKRPPGTKEERRSGNAAGLGSLL